MTDNATPDRVHWLCSECGNGAPPETWGILHDEDTGEPNNDTAVCPNCGFEHRDDDLSFVDEVVPDGPWGTNT